MNEKKLGAERSLDEAWSRIEYILNAIDDGFWENNFQTNEFRYSNRIFTMLGYPVLQGFEGFEFLKSKIHPDTTNSFQHEMEQLINGRKSSWNFVFRMEAADGSWHYIQSRGNCVARDEKGTGFHFVGTHTDITQQKKSEEALLENNRRLQNIIEGTRAGTWEWNIETGEAIFNDLWAEIIGYTLEELAPVSIGTWMKYAHPEDLEQSGKLLEKHFKGELDFYEHECRMKHKNGSWIWVLDRGKVSKWSDDGKPLFMSGTHQDITARKEMEEKLIISEQKALSASSAKSEFLANMSHEIRTPLNGVIGYTDLLLKTDLNEIQKQYAQKANISGKTLLGIINDILDFSKIEAKKLELEIIETNIIGLVREVIDIIAFQAEQKGLKLLLSIPAEMPEKADVDPVRLKQILINLLNNAVKFTEKGEVELKIEYARLDDSKIRYEFFIRDTGIGIREEEKSKLFKAFSQADNSTTRKFGGTGLGLTISTLLAIKMGSQIEMKSEFGKGSLFHFAIVANCTEREKMKLSESDKALTILVAEDVDFNMHLIKELIRGMFSNTGIIEARNGNEAVDKVKNHQVDIILMDIQMPMTDGIEATRQIRQLERQSNKHIPIIALTAGAIKEEKEKAIAAGMDDFITKPVESQQLHHVLKTHLFDGDKNHFDRPYFLKIIRKKENLNDLLQQAQLDIIKNITELDYAISAENMKNIQKIAHTIKGISYNMRFSILAKLAEELEKAAQNGDYEVIMHITENMHEEWKKILPLLNPAE